MLVIILRQQKLLYDFLDIMLIYFIWHIFMNVKYIWIY